MDSFQLLVDLFGLVLTFLRRPFQIMGVQISLMNIVVGMAIAGLIIWFIFAALNSAGGGD